MRVQVVLGELVVAAREGLLALSVGVGLGVLVVSTRRYRRTQEPVGVEVEGAARLTSKSAVRAFVERTRETLGELMGRWLDDVRLAVMMLDGIELKGRTNIVALGITTEGGQDPARALGRLDPERDGRDRALE